MNRLRIATIVLRLAALFFWTQAVLALPYAAGFLAASRSSTESASLISLAVLGPAVVEAVVGTILWLGSARWAWRLDASGSESAADAESIGTVAFRLAGIWLLDICLGRGLTAASNLAVERISGFEPVARAELCAALTVLAVAIVLFLRAPALSRRFFAKGDASSATALQPLAFSIAGLALLASALPDLVMVLARPVLSEEDWSSPALGARLLGNCARAALGLYLFFGSRSIARIWRWMQTAGLEQHPVSGA